MHPIVEIQNVNKKFDNMVLSDINFTFLEGQTVGLIGKNGAGKTTLIKIILGFIKPTAGKIKVFGKEPRKAVGNIGYLPEKPDYHLLFSGKEYLTLLGQISGISGIGQRVNDVLELVDMKEQASKKMSRYSKGMLQRIGVAQAILLDPQLLILDEPLSGLDPEGQKVLRDIIIELQRMGKSILLCSHLLNEVEKICTDVAIIDHGKIIKHESVDQALAYHDRYEIKFNVIETEVIQNLKVQFALNEMGQDFYSFDEKNKGEKEVLLAKLLDVGAVIQELKPARNSLEDYFIMITRGYQK